MMHVEGTFDDALAEARRKAKETGEDYSVVKSCLPYTYLILPTRSLEVDYSEREDPNWEE